MSKSIEQFKTLDIKGWLTIVFCEICLCNIGDNARAVVVYTRGGNHYVLCTSCMDKLVKEKNS